MDIKQIISSLIKLMTTLSTMLDTEKELLLKDNGPELAQAVEDKRQLLIEISQLEITRQKTYGSKSLAEFINLGMIDEQEGKALISLTEHIKEKNEIINLLTRQSLNYIRLMTSILNPTPKTPTYGNNGKIQGNQPKGLFTTSV